MTKLFSLELNFYRFKKIGSPEHQLTVKRSQVSDVIVQDDEEIVADYEQHPAHLNNGSYNGDLDDEAAGKLPFFKRALPPLPKSNGHVNTAADSQGGADNGATINGCNGSVGISPANSTQGLNQDTEERVSNEDTSMDFAASIEKVKDVSK